MSMLSNEDKIAIINQHKRNLEYTRYGYEVGIIAESATSVPNQETINTFNSEIAELDRKLDALDLEIASLS